MALISERKKNTESSGSYAVVLNNKELGKLVTAVHGTSISNGRQLEQLIMNETTAKTIENIDELQCVLNKDFGNEDLWIVPKSIVKRMWNLKNEPDFLVIQKLGECIYIIELKMGWTFDTKKVKGEWRQLEDFSNHIAGSVRYETKTIMCSFNADSIDQMYNGFKRIIEKKNLMTGREFCSMVRINYEKIKSVFDNDAEKNLNFFIETMLSIPEIKEILLKKTRSLNEI